MTAGQQPGPDELGTEAVVRMRGITVEFPGVKALDSVNFRLLPGEVHALMGENGAGKSTLIKALTGIFPITDGEILVDGKPVSFSGPADAERSGISTVYQEVNLCTNLTIGENVMLGHEVRGRFGISWRRTHRAAAEALAGLGLAGLDTHRLLDSVPIAIQQLIAIGRATITNSRVLILDEPTSSLDAVEVEVLFGVIRRLRDSGVAILFVSHFLDQVFTISDRMTVLRNGRFEGEFVTRDIDRATLVSTMIGRDAASLTKLAPVRRTEGERAGEVPVLEAVDLGRKGSLSPTSLALYRGEVLGLAGLLGSGRTEIARLLYGADRADTGSTRVNGKQTAIHSPAKALSHGLALSSENRRDEGIIADLSIRENIILAVQARRGWARPLSRKEQDAIVEKYMDDLDVRPRDPERPIKNLSGGNQQKALLGRWLATNPDVLILDEPTRGIDVGAKAEIQQKVAELAADGVSVVFISSELEEVVRLSGRIVVMRDRAKVTEIVNDGDVSVDSVIAVIADADGQAIDGHDSEGAA